MCRSPTLTRALFAYRESHSCFWIQLGFRKLHKDKEKCCRPLALSLSFGNQKDEWCRWPLLILIPASQPVQHHKRVLWKGTNSAPSLITSVCPVLWAPAWPPTFLFFIIPLRHPSPSLGQPVYFSPSTPWMSSFIHWLSSSRPHCVFFCGHNWSSALREQVDELVCCFRKNLSPSLFYGTGL